MPWLRKNRISIIGGSILVLVILGLFVYKIWYIPYRDRKEGFVIVRSFDCPAGYPVKAHLGSMIYHDPGDPYYNRTWASNGYCFDTNQHAEQQGFRSSYGTPATTYTAPPISNTHQGGYTPDGTFCTYGYSSRTKACCDDDDYSCEVQDLAPKGATAVCMDGTYSLTQNSAFDCSAHGGVQTDPQYTPFVTQS